MITNSEKARKLYEECDETNPKESVLIPWNYEGFNDKNIYYSMIAGLIINHYAINEFKDGWIPNNRETFYIPKWDKEGWKSYKSTIYRMEKKGFLETKSENGKNYIRLTNDELYDKEIYNRIGD